MRLDVRLPLGAFFTMLGALLTGFGALGPRGLYQPSLGINVNLWWGLAQLAFGVALLAAVYRARRAGRARSGGARGAKP